MYTMFLANLPLCLLLFFVLLLILFCQRKEQTAEGNFWLCFFERNKTEGRRVLMNDGVVGFVVGVTAS